MRTKPARSPGARWVRFGLQCAVECAGAGGTEFVGRVRVAADNERDPRWTDRRRPAAKNEADRPTQRGGATVSQGIASGGLAGQWRVHIDGEVQDVLSALKYFPT
jgi:hypothetical protein